jgi:tRNA pseudouridine55 synthase
VVDKPPGVTSHDVVDAGRRWLGTRRVGHLGTLDPLATGVLPLAVREATKLVPFVEGGLKSYAGAIRLGEETDTFDAEGKVVRRHQGPLPSEAEVRAALAGFVGEIEQVPPMFSAVKRGGVPLHRLAREGTWVERAPKRVRIERLALVAWVPPDLEIEVDCSAGTYVRALASDLGRRLGCGAHLSFLRRTRSGPFHVGQARPLAELEAMAEAGGVEKCLLSPLEVLGLPVVRLTPQEVERVLHGGDVAGGSRPLAPGTRVAGVAPDGRLLAVLEMQAGRRLQPLRVLAALAPPGPLCHTPRPLHSERKA